MLEFNCVLTISYEDIKEYIELKKITELKDFIETKNVEHSVINFICNKYDNIYTTEQYLNNECWEQTGNSASLYLERSALKAIAEITERTEEEVYEAYEKYADGE